MLQLARRALACSLGSKKDLRKQVYNITALHRHAVHPVSIMHAAALGLWARQLCRCAMVGKAPEQQAERRFSTDLTPGTCDGGGGDALERARAKYKVLGCRTRA